MEDELIYEIGLKSRSLIFAWLTWTADTAEHQQARDKIIVDFTKDILTLIRKREIEARIDELKAPYIQMDCIKLRIEELEQQLEEVE